MNNNTHKSIVKSVFSVTGIIIVAKMLGFVKQMVMGSSFGATLETDLISISQGVVNDLEYLLVQMFFTAFIPIYIGVKQNNRNSADRFVTNSLIVWSGLSSILIIGLEVFAPIVSKLLAPTYSATMSDMLVGYIRIYAPAVLVLVMSAVFNAVLRANQSFVPGELVSVIQSITMIALIIIFGNSIGVNSIVIGFYIYIFIDIVFLLFCSRHYWRVSVKKTIFDENVRQLISMSIPLLLGYSMVFFNQQIDKIIVSGLGDGVVTSIGYAAVLTNLFATLIGSVSSVVFTYVSQDVACGNDQIVAKRITRSSVVFTTVLIPISSLIILNSRDIVKIVYGRGAFLDEAISNTSLALVGYGFSIVFYAYRELFGRMHYSYKDSKRPMINSCLGIVLNIVLSIILSRHIGLIGVTLASSFSTLFSAVLNVITSKQHNKFIKLSDIYRYAYVWILGVVECVLVSWLVGDWLSEEAAIVRFIIIVVLTILLYGITCIPTIRKFVPIIKSLSKDNINNR